MSSCCFVAAAGYLFFAYVVFRLLKAVYNIVYPFLIASPIKDLVAFTGGKWAVVTGSTDGIGKGYAMELARKGFNIVLVSRNQQKLDDVKQEIENLVSGCEVKTIAYDFLNPNAEHYLDRIAKHLVGLDVGVLVNNVGMALEYPERLTKVEGGLNRLSDVLVVNTMPPTLMTTLVLPQMLERHKGVVINVSSIASYTPMALFTVYSASKKYVDWFTAALRLEYANTGVLFQTVSPFFVATKMSKIKKTSFITVAPEMYASSAVNTIGVLSVTNGCLPHQMIGELLQLIPSCVLNYFTTKETLAIRKRALDKKERDAAKLDKEE